jgi:hypothetical protein
METTTFFSFSLIFNCSLLSFQHRSCLANLQCRDRCQRSRQRSKNDDNDSTKKKLLQKIFWDLEKEKIKSEKSVNNKVVCYCDKNKFNKTFLFLGLEKMKSSLMCPTLFVKSVISLFPISVFFNVQKFPIIWWINQYPWSPSWESLPRVFSNILF